MYLPHYFWRSSFQIAILFFAILTLLGLAGGLAPVLCEFGLALRKSLPFRPGKTDMLVTLIWLSMAYSLFHAPFVCMALRRKRTRFLMVPILLSPSVVAFGVDWVWVCFPQLHPILLPCFYTSTVIGATILLRYLLPDRVGLKPGHCVRCDYDLTGNESGRCPECGEQIQGPTNET